ncbi:SHOCT domain-containing protein [Allostreptomyces psammosilenae]|uniref:SHOCT domain-containing protein n=1 Tax=Allostreptomyces psammosilenae TaxID=1892865 RepID=A0A852ZN86_9ACTN|nr:SHOCT domain-containing protein [Allostreptomyces psammosilenae]NYI03125.1 hypothetical protein [Allostreptomyces psammosilenae]
MANGPAPPPPGGAPPDPAVPEPPAPPEPPERTGPLGPVDVMALAFPGTVLDPALAEHFGRVLLHGAVEPLDAVVVRREPDGRVTTGELEGEPGFQHLAEELHGGGTVGLLTGEHLVAVGEVMEPGSVVVLLVLENVWAREVAGAIRSVGGRLLTSTRLGHEQAPDLPTLRRRQRAAQEAAARRLRGERAEAARAQLRNPFAMGEPGAQVVAGEAGLSAHPPPEDTHGPPEAEPFDELLRLADLHAAGELTDGEYAELKRRLLAEWRRPGGPAGG